MGTLRGVEVPPRDQQGCQHSENVSWVGVGDCRVSSALSCGGVLLEAEPS